MNERLKQPPLEGFVRLAESEHFVLGHTWENAVLYHPGSGVLHPAGTHYGDPVTGVIGRSEQWAATAGEGIVVLRIEPEGVSLHPFFRAPASEPRSVHAVREVDGHLRVLLDPWSEYASVWSIDPFSLLATWLQDGPDLRGQAFRESIPF